MSASGNELLRVFEALANPHRMRIVAILHGQRKYVSELAREIRISRPLLYMHLQRLEAAGLVSGQLELAADGKAMKYYQLCSFEYPLTPSLIAEAVKTLISKNPSDGNEEEHE